MLPPAFASELGWTIAGFGHLEDMLKRAIFALDRGRLSGAIRDIDFQSWLQQMDHVAADSLGTLIERLDRTLARSGNALPDLISELDAIKFSRNLLCHAAWLPTDDDDEWIPLFANTRGETFETPMTVHKLIGVRNRTLDAAARIGRLIDQANDLA